MSEHPSTHDIARETGAGDRPKPERLSDDHPPEAGGQGEAPQDGKAEQLQPDGR